MTAREYSLFTGNDFITGPCILYVRPGITGFCSFFELESWKICAKTITKGVCYKRKILRMRIEVKTLAVTRMGLGLLYGFKASVA